MTRKSSLRVERDRSFDADDPTGWTVTRYHRTGWSVLYRGTREECQNYAAQEVEAAQWNAANRS